MSELEASLVYTSNSRPARLYHETLSPKPRRKEGGSKENRGNEGTNKRRSWKRVWGDGCDPSLWNTCLNIFMKPNYSAQLMCTNQKDEMLI